MSNIEIDTTRLKSLINESVEALNPDKEDHLEETIAVSQVTKDVQIQIVVTRNKLNYITPKTDNICIECS